MISQTPSFSEILELLVNGQDLDHSQSTSLMNSWLSDEFHPVQTGALLAALRSKSVSGIELSAMAQVLKAACPLPTEVPDYFLVDTCGTGGDGANTFNISTAVAFVAAACGVKIAKHGNRSASGNVGSADVLEALGIPLNAPLEKVVQSLKTTNITFLFAPSWHPALVNLAPLRKSLGIRTIFNLLGPLVNPLKPKAQVLGVAKSNLLDPMSLALKDIGLQKAIVVHGAGGLDEASLAGENQLRFLENGMLRSETISPDQLNLKLAPLSSIEGSNLEKNSEILHSLLTGNGIEAHKEVVAFNTALVLWVAGIESDLKSGVSTAMDCLRSDKPWLVFNELKSFLEN